LKIQVILKKDLASDEEAHKIMLVAMERDKVYELKRLIESEFMDLFPNELSFVVAKLQDHQGYTLSNSC
jgi:hypothetical protein